APTPPHEDAVDRLVDRWTHSAPFLADVHECAMDLVVAVTHFDLLAVVTALDPVQFREQQVGDRVKLARHRMLMAAFGIVAHDREAEIVHDELLDRLAFAEELLVRTGQHAVQAVSALERSVDKKQWHGGIL